VKPVDIKKAVINSKHTGAEAILVTPQHIQQDHKEVFTSAAELSQQIRSHLTRVIATPAILSILHSPTAFLHLKHSESSSCVSPGSLLSIVPHFLLAIGNEAFQLSNRFSRKIHSRQ